MREPDRENVFGALRQFVQEHMPWPFYDVSRHDTEGIEAAHEIARRLLPAVEREFADVVTTAKAVKRRSYPPEAR